MCGRFTLTTTPEQLVDHFDLDNTLAFPPHYNIAPSQEIVTICNLPDKQTVAVMMRWGLIPHWAKEMKIGYKMINARAETVHEKPAFRQAFQQQRCLIPADGFYEWQHKGDKIPHYVYLRGHNLFAFAGLWDKWINDKGKTINSCTIITTQANKPLSKLHDRMPVMLEKGHYQDWLAPQSTAEELLQLLSPFPANQINMHPVSKLVNNPRNDLPDCIDMI